MILAAALAVIGSGLLARGIWSERQMQKHRQPGVSYADVTFRRDGGWRRADLFTEDGLRHQRQASVFGFGGLVVLVIALIVAAMTSS